MDAERGAMRVETWSTGGAGGARHGVAVFVLLAALTACQATLPPPPAPPVAAAMAADADYLGDPARDGRVLGSEGRAEAVDYIARRFREAGLDPVTRQRFTVRSTLLSGEAENVVAVVPGTDPALRGELVVVGAHFDHIGRLSELSRDPMRSGIRPGADDNASGTAAMLELARRVAKRPAPRSVVFVAFDAEELGFFGSRRFLEHPPAPPDSIVAMLNLDMVGRLRGRRLTIEGATSHPAWKPMLEAANRSPRLELRFRPGGDSDEASFHQAGIPAIHFFTGLHRAYHTMDDRVDELNGYGMLRVVELAERVLRSVAASPAFGPAPAPPGPSMERPSAPRVSDGAPASVAGEVSRFEARLARDVVADSVGSIAAAVVLGDEVVWQGAFGWQSRSAATLATPRTLYRVGSITKTLTAMLLLRLVDEGVLSLDDPVSRYVPEVERLRGTPDGVDAITVGELASHTAGLPREPTDERAGRGRYRTWERKVLAAIPATEVPGPRGWYRYSNIGYAILGLAMERAAGRPYGTLLRDLVLQPLGMDDTFLEVSGDARRRLATGYVNPPGVEPDPRVPTAEVEGRGYRVPSGGAFSTADDMARLLMALTGSRSALPAGLADRMTKLRATASDGAAGGERGGYGLGLHVLEIGGVTLAGHGGTVAGFTAYLLFDPETRAGVVLLRNYNNGRTNLASSAVDLLLGIHHAVGAAAL